MVYTLVVVRSIASSIIFSIPLTNNKHLYSKDDPECISKLKNKLIEASQVYSKDKETLSWFVMQSEKDERAFTIVERYEQESVSTTRKA